MKIIEPELVTAIISFLKPGVAGGIPCPWCPRLAIWYDYIPRLVIPGGLDCAVLEFTQLNIPDQYKNRKIFLYDFRSAIRLNTEETSWLANQLAEKLNRDAVNVKVLIPTRGWSEADREGGPLYDPAMNSLFTGRLKEVLDPLIEIQEVDQHINDSAFADAAAGLMNKMINK